MYISGTLNIIVYNGKMAGAKFVVFTQVCLAVFKVKVHLWRLVLYTLDRRLWLRSLVLQG